jgi:hypothetical protein
MRSPCETSSAVTYLPIYNTEDHVIARAGEFTGRRPNTGGEFGDLGIPGRLSRVH